MTTHHVDLVTVSNKLTQVTHDQTLEWLIEKFTCCKPRHWKDCMEPSLRKNSITNKSELLEYRGIRYFKQYFYDIKNKN